MEAPSTDLELRPYSAVGVDDRTSTLPPAMASYPGPTGQNPFAEGHPGCTRVLLAEHFTPSTRFELPTDSSSDQITTKLAYCTPVPFSSRSLDATGIEMAIAMLAYTRAACRLNRPINHRCPEGHVFCGVRVISLPPISSRDRLPPSVGVLTFLRFVTPDSRGRRPFLAYEDRPDAAARPMPVALVVH